MGQTKIRITYNTYGDVIARNYVLEFNISQGKIYQNDFYV